MKKGIFIVVLAGFLAIAGRVNAGTNGQLFVVSYTSDDLVVYPNPVVSQTHIVLPAPATAKTDVYIIDMNGVIVSHNEYAPGDTRLDVDMSALPRGYYTARIISEDGLYQVRLLKED